MNIISLLAQRWPPADDVLFTPYGVEITTGGLLLLLAMTLLGVLIRRPTGRLAERLATKRKIEDERVLKFISDLAAITVLLLCVGVGLELGQIITLPQFTDAIFGLLNFSLFKIADTPISLMTVAIVTVVMMVSSWVSRMVQGGVRQTAALQLGSRVNPATVKAFERLIHYLILMLGLGVGLQTAGVNLSALFAAGAVFAVGLGFAMQNIAQNFVSGIIVMVERVIRPGDVLELEGQVVRVEEMGIRSTVVRTLSDEFLIVPNASLAQNTIKNYTLRKPALRIRAMVGVAYESDLRAVRQALLAAASRVEGQVAGQEPIALLRDFGASSVDFELSIWIGDPWSRDRRTSELRDAIWWALKEHGITIAFPQLDIHVDAPLMQALSRAS